MTRAFRKEVLHYGECMFLVRVLKRGVRWTVYTQSFERITSVDTPTRTSQAKVYEKCLEAIKSKEISDEIDAHDETYLRALDKYHLR